MAMKSHFDICYIFSSISCFFFMLWYHHDALIIWIVLYDIYYLASVNLHHLLLLFVIYYCHNLYFLVCIIYKVWNQLICSLGKRKRRCFYCDLLMYILIYFIIVILNINLIIFIVGLYFFQQYGRPFLFKYSYCFTYPHFKFLYTSVIYVICLYLDIILFLKKQCCK